MTGSEADGEAYRRCVGIMLIDSERRAFVARRSDTEEEAWQMPQGGIDPGEAPLDAAFRELYEETGVTSAVLIVESAVWRCYDLPVELRPRVWGGRFRGQQQKWFLMRFTGADHEIDLAHHAPEFVDWRWVAPSALPDLVVGFKRAVYEAVLAEFAPWLDPTREARKVSR